MKKVLVIAAFSFSLNASAQMKEGKVIFERTMQLQFRGPERPENLPRERKDKFELSFANNQSVWESIPEMDDNNNDAGGGDGNGRMSIRFGVGDDKAYHNFETGRRIDQRELNSKNYIVEDSIQKLKWKLTGESKTILGHKTQLARAERIGKRFMLSMENGEMKRQEVADTAHINAWFAMDIPVPAGPDFQGQLPGLILELDMNNGRVVYRALEISPKVNVASIKEPKGGKHIAAAEYNKEREKVLEEMRRNMPTGGQMRIVTQ
jgi:GLPGLI family protein